MADSLPEHDRSAPADWITAISTCIPDALLDGAGAERVIRCASTLPACAADTGLGFEFRLGSPEPDGDMYIVANPHTPFGEHLVGVGEADGATPASRGLSRYLREVGRRDSFLSRWLKYAVLEYDLHGATGDTPPAPGIFLESHDREDADPLVASSPRQHLRHGNPGLLTSAICFAAGWEEDDRERGFVESLFGLLPRSARSAHVGAFPGREPRAIRLVIGMPPDEAPGYLHRAGWTGSTADLPDLMEGMKASGLRRVGLSIDVGPDGLAPRIGFELFISAGWYRLPQRWSKLISWLADHGLCLPEKERALRHWPRRELLFLDRGTRRMLSGLNHFKLVVTGDSVQAKAYAGMELIRLP